MAKTQDLYDPLCIHFLCFLLIRQTYCSMIKVQETYLAMKIHLKCVDCMDVPWKSNDYLLNGFSVKTIVLVRVYNQQFQGTIL